MGRQQNEPNRFRQAYGRGYQSGPAYQRGNYQRPQRDPNAMDVDALTLNERSDYLKKGLCFKCGQPGHMSRDHQNQQRSNDRFDSNQGRLNNRGGFSNRNQDRTPTFRSNNPFKKSDESPKKLAPKDINRYIKALTAEERDELFDIAEADDGEKGPKEKDFS